MGSQDTTWLAGAGSSVLYLCALGCRCGWGVSMVLLPHGSQGQHETGPPCLRLSASAGEGELCSFSSEVCVALTMHGSIQAAERLHSGETMPPTTVELRGQFMTSVEVCFYHCWAVCATNAMMLSY